MRLLEVIQRSTAFLEARSVESPRLQVELILARILGLPRLQLYLEFERQLNEAQLDAARQAIRRRAEREPLQHILGTAVFCGLELEVSPDALVPRPETELLAERTWILAKEILAGNAGECRVLDWGTGTGCIAIAVAVNAPGTQVLALDRSPAALAMARRNVQRHACSDRIELLETDGCRSLPDNLRFHIVVSNPPYVPTAEIDSLAPEVRDHDPRLALDGGTDGLDLYRRLATELRERVTLPGSILLEFGDGQSHSVQEILRDAGWVVAEVHRDYSGRDRFLLARLTS